MFVEHLLSGCSNHVTMFIKACNSWGFLGGAVVKNLPANAGDTGSSLGP